MGLFNEKKRWLVNLSCDRRGAAPRRSFATLL